MEKKVERTGKKAIPYLSQKYDFGKPNRKISIPGKPDRVAVTANAPALVRVGDPAWAPKNAGVPRYRIPNGR